MLKNRTKSKIHLNMLLPCREDTVALAAAVTERFIDLTKRWIKPPPFGKGEMLIPPKELTRDMLLWRTMCVRFKKGDFRATMDEERSLKRVAQWTLQKNSILTGQPYIPCPFMD